MISHLACPISLSRPFTLLIPEPLSAFESWSAHFRKNMHKFAHLSLLWHICCNQSCSGWGFKLNASAEINRSKPLFCFALHRHTLGVLPCAFRVYAATRSLPFSPPL